VGIVGIVALALSYDALYQMASQHGHAGWKAYAWPTLIDLPLVVFTLAMLYAQIRRMSGWTIVSLLGLVLTYTGVTVYLNYLESDSSIEGVFIRVSAPVGLFVCTEVLRHLLRFEIEQGSKAKTLAQLTAQLETAQNDLDQLNRQITQNKNELTQVRVQKEEVEIQKPADMSDETRECAFTILDEWKTRNINLNRKGAKLSREISKKLHRKISYQTGLSLLKEYQKIIIKQNSFHQNSFHVVNTSPMNQADKDLLRKSINNKS